VGVSQSKDGLLWGTPWRVVDRVAISDLAETVLAEHEQSKARAHVKVLRLESVEELATPPQRRAKGERIRLERDALMELRAERVPALCDSGLTPDGRLYFATEIIEGARPLSQILVEKHELTVDETVKILLDVLSALEAAHRAGVVHRGVAPSSVLVRDGRAWLTDFGVAKVVSAAETGPVEPISNPTTAGKRLGPALYLSPEQALGKPVDARTDLYQVGLLAFECLKTKDVDNTDFVRARASASAPPLSALSRQPVPRELDALAAKAVEMDPRKRFQSAGEMSDALRHVAAKVDPNRTEVLPADGLRRLLDDDVPTEEIGKDELARAVQLAKATADAPPRARLAVQPLIADDEIAPVEPPPRRSAKLAVKRRSRVPAWALLLLGAIVGGIALWLLERGLR
jgi:serine/threonine protein kinase